MKTKEEYQKGTLSEIRDNFRVYPDMVSGVKGYFDFINTKRYANLKDAATPQQYLERIRADGYATSFTYVTTNVNCIKLNALTSYDTRPYITLEEIAREVIEGKWGNGDERRARITDAGFNYAMVQAEVNRLLKEGE
jgi:flagellum-specific peptidoglycan hydrolase FlgJ